MKKIDIMILVAFFVCMATFAAVNVTDTLARTNPATVYKSGDYKVNLEAYATLDDFTFAILSFDLSDPSYPVLSVQMSVKGHSAIINTSDYTFHMYLAGPACVYSDLSRTATGFKVTLNSVMVDYLINSTSSNLSTGTALLIDGDYSYQLNFYFYPNQLSTAMKGARQKALEKTSKM